MATPTVASVSAGASLMPSPSMATATATRDQLLDPGKLVLRQQVGFDLADAESASDGNCNRFRVERTSRVIRKVSAAAPRAK
jgi:hypothetical protein